MSSNQKVPQLEFADAPSGRIAYQQWGAGDVDVIAIPPAAQNVEMAWESPHIRRMLDRLGSFAKMVAFDKRGTGCSDRQSLVAGLDERVDDLEAVFDAAGVDRAFLFAQSEGGPMAILFAATYPERVLGLVLLGTAPSMAPEGVTEAQRAARREGDEEFVREWGTPETRVVELFAPSLAQDEEFKLWHQRYERVAASADSLRDLLNEGRLFDVRGALPSLTVPTLVVHRTDDLVIPVMYGRELAEKIPGAELFEVPGNDHFAFAGDIDPWMTKMEKFVTGTVQDRRSPRPVGPTSIRCFGGFSVTVGGEEVPHAEWGSKAARQLCKRLVIARGWPVTRDSLFEQFWPDETDRGRVGSRLSVLLSNVRRVLGGGVIATRETVRLDLTAVSTDLEDLLTTDNAETVLSIYQTGFLPEDRYEDWASETTGRARSVFIKAAKGGVAEAQESGNLPGAVELLYRLRSEDPYDEDTHRKLVRLLKAAGEVTGARAAHSAWEEAMEDLGVGPPPGFDPTP